MTITAPPAAIERNYQGRPLIIPEGGGKPAAMSRVTTYIDCIDDKFNLQKWSQRMLAKGLADTEDLLAAIRRTPPEDKRTLDDLCKDARTAGGADISAAIGSAMHTLTENHDRGEGLSQSAIELLESHGIAWRAMLDAYIEATADLKHKHIETFVVMDPLGVAGTPDRISGYEGAIYVVDLKTGDIVWGALKIAMQLAIYSRSKLYDPATGERTVHGASTNRGIIVHLPAVTDPAEATCTLHWIDLEAGWSAVQVAKAVREQRKIRFAQLTEPFVGKPDRPSLHLAKAAEAKAEAREAVLDANQSAGIEALIGMAADREGLEALWAMYERDWTPAHTELAKARAAAIEASA